MTIRPIAPLTASALAWALFAGCSSSEPVVAPPTTSGLELPAEPFQDADPVEALVLEDDQIALINQLPEDEAPIALAQKVCPVSDEPLGSMGVPIRVDANGIPVFVCCAGCEDGVTADPEEILAKVPQGKADAAPALAPGPEGEGS